MALFPLVARRTLIMTLAAAAALAGSSAAHAQTAFTYQGVLKSGGNAYTGTADVRFTLYDAAAAGNVVGAAVDVINATITDGVFTSELDFGALAFDGPARWLQIEVVTPSAGGGGSYIALSPRQPVSPAPYAMFAALAGLVPDAALTGAYTNALSMTNAANVFAGDGSGLLGLDASNITAGQLASGQLGGAYGNALSLTNAGNTFVGDGSGLTSLDWNNLVSMPAGFADGIDDVGVGTSQWTGAVGSDIYYNSAGARVGIGRVPATGFKFDVRTDPNTGIRLGLDGNGGGALILANNFGDNKIFIEGFNSTNNGSASEMLFTGYAGGLIPKITLRGSTVLAEGQVGISPTAGFAPHPNARLHVKATTLDGIIAETVGVGKAIVGATTGGGTGVWASGTGAGSRGSASWTDNGFCAASGDHTTGGTYGLLGTLNEGIYGNGGPNGKTGIVGVAGGSGNGIVASHVGGSTSAAGLFGNSLAFNGNGIIGEANTGSSAYGVWGRATQGIGGFFSGGSYAIYAAGKARCTTIEIAGGADLAEPFDIASHDEHGSQLDIEPGMVVVIDPANPGALRIATSANDRKVAGIISGANDLAPGMIMKSEGGEYVDGDHPVALTGRVWCWCDAAAAAIEPGDMLTTSDVAGHAMRVLDLDAAQGAIIGKAMTPLAAGERGLVLVLVNLQ